MKYNNTKKQTKKEKTNPHKKHLKSKKINKKKKPTYLLRNKKPKKLNLDYLGVPAGICKIIRLAERMNSRLKSLRKVSPGHAVQALVINGLGCANRRLYLAAEYFKDKPVDILLDKSLESSDLTDDTLARTLDDIHKYGTSKLFMELVSDMILDLGLPPGIVHLDSTSISVEGEYANQAEDAKVKMNRGYSKDHRPDLNQCVLSIVMGTEANLPIFMETFSGNSSDKKTFPESATKYHEFAKAIQMPPERWVADSAFYTKHNIQHAPFVWLTRVPETIREAKMLVEKEYSQDAWVYHSPGYRFVKHESSYGKIKHRWIVVESEKAKAREKKTLEKKIAKEEELLKKQLLKAGKKIFSSTQEAQRACDEIMEKSRFFLANSEIEVIEKHAGCGRPKKNAPKVQVGFSIKAVCVRNEKRIAEVLRSKGRFILATNELDESKLPDHKILDDYKRQDNVERGFRFLKDPLFRVSSVFLKLPHRIEALNMVMTLTLFVHNYGQYLIRKALEKNNETVPDQTNKPTKRPTLSWIFHLLKNIEVVKSRKNGGYVNGVDDLQYKIILLFGEDIAFIYGIVPD